MTFNAPRKTPSESIVGKRENTDNLFLPHKRQKSMFYLNLSSANDFSFNKAKILSSGKGLNFYYIKSCFIF